MKKVTAIIIFSILLFQGCQNQKKENIPEKIQLTTSWEEIENAPGMSYETFFDSLEVINTPNVSKIPLGQITRIITAGDYMAALTNKSLAVMNRHDTTRYIYNKEGRGPGEYLMLEDVIFDEEHQKLLLLTGYPNRILTLDLQCHYISSYSLPYEIMWERLYFHKGELYIFGELSDPNKKDMDVVSKFSGNKFGKIVEITHRNLDGSSSWYWNISEKADQLIVSIDARDSLFILSDTLGVTPVKLEYPHEKSAGINKMDTQKLLYINDHNMMLKRAADKEGYNSMKFFLYDFDNQHCSVFLYLVYTGHFINSDKENMYYTVLPANEVPFLKEFEEKASPAIKQFYKQLYKLLESCDEDDNPILLRFHVRQ